MNITITASKLDFTKIYPAHVGLKVMLTLYHVVHKTSDFVLATCELWP